MEHLNSNHKGSMQIVDVIVDSFQEFDELHSLVLFSYGCNLACPGCYNYDRINKRKNIIGDAIPIIDKHLNPMHEGVVFLGGEPTIWGDELLNTLQYVKDKGLKIKVYTNGIRPDIILDICERKIIDAFSIDLKCIEDVRYIIGRAMTDSDYTNLVTRSIGIVSSYKIPVEIRSVKWDGVDTDKISTFIFDRFPDIKHIVSSDFRKNITFNISDYIEEKKNAK